MREINLTRDLVGLIDDEDFERFGHFKWFAKPGGNGHYAARRPVRGGGIVLLHRLIMDAPEGSFIDHINGDGVDNRRSNLRFCTKAENAWNAAPRRGTMLPKGVFSQISSTKAAHRYYAKITYNGHSVYLGAFTSAADAGRAYDTAARRYYGEFARLNFPHDDPSVPVFCGAAS